MTCCGQGRANLRTSQAAIPKSPGARPAAVVGFGRAIVAAAQKPVAMVRYIGAAPIVVHGAVSGRTYQFTAARSVQPVDARDIAGLLKKGIFRRHA
jgi:hypothetical protein